MELEVWVDPGFAGAYAVLFVAIDGPLVFVVDEVYAKGKVAEQVILECQRKRDLWERVRRGVIDVAGRQHQGMESHVEIWRRIADVSLESERVEIVDGIHLHRKFLLDPTTRTPRLFHDPKCAGTIAEYGLYRYRDEAPNRDERELPIDASNHAMKSIAYGLYRRFGWVAKKRPVLQPRNLIDEYLRSQGLPGRDGFDGRYARDENGNQYDVAARRRYLEGIGGQ